MGPTMFADQLTGAITAARRLDQLDHVARDVWRAFGAGVLADDQAETLSAALESRRQALRGGPATSDAPRLERPSPSIFPPRRAQRSPDRRKSLERRRHLAASGPLPPRLACMFTQGEMAVLKIVADEIAARGVCSRTLGEIAARAGTCRSVAQRALRAAAKAGIVIVKERRRRGQPNLPNTVRIVSREWLDWIAKGPRRGGQGGGCLFRAPTDRSSRKEGKADQRNTPAAGMHGLHRTERIRSKWLMGERGKGGIIGAGQTWA